MKYKLCILCLTIFFNSLLIAASYEVKQDGSGDYTLIQTAIDSSVSGDTITVYPGTYYENINFNGKNIFLSSLFHTTDNESYIESTIIDGNNNGTVVCFNNEETNSATLKGFTIQNGSGKVISEYSIIGGGIYINHSSPSLINNIITNNKADCGGGISLSSTNAYLEDLTITSNHGYAHTGGLMIYNEPPNATNSNITFSEENPCSIYNNTGATTADIFIFYNIHYLTNIYLDTFTTTTPGWDYVTQYPNLGLHYNNVWLEQIESDLYVSPEGNNENSGITPEDPFKTIQWALSKIKADSLNPRTIHLAPGIYSPETNGEFFGLNARSFVKIQGAGSDFTYLESPTTRFRIIFCDEDINCEFSYFTIRDIEDVSQTAIRAEGTITKFSHMRFENINVENRSCIVTQNSTIIENCEFINNSGSAAIGIGTNGNNNLEYAFLKNLVFLDNVKQSPFYTGGGSFFISDVVNVEISNCLIGNNEASDNYWPMPQIFLLDCDTVNFVNNTVYGNYNNGGAICFGDGLDNGTGESKQVNIVNSIIYNNPTYTFQTERGEVPTEVNISNSIIQGGTDPQIVHNAGTDPYPVDFIFGENIIDQDPLLVLGEDPNVIDFYNLQSGSPAIDTGINYTDNGYVMPETDLLGNPRVYGQTVDLGCIEWNGTGTFEDYIQSIKSTLTNYPNPFNTSNNSRTGKTTVKYELKESGNIDLSIYNIKGQKVTNLIDAYSERGTFEIHWNGKDDKGKNVASGTYLLKLSIDSRFIKCRKIMLLK